ncbi:SDR family oxidoreductase [Streptomyces gibsoniae]|uniref:SDR family oxidoreductase n=1 Tax=Streptomyces gibsoniae TaxID=3075529 RepID=A0ABU2U1T7_9ACTN|nr:SDR family oxidoreductase [Streptomyces sp. DSM 41699]MDT0467195.1 SDR family oxidoreductase [Streptomyces sp. DSM 41699]
MKSLFDVTGKTVVITGGTRGIGLTMARGLVEAGASVVISSRKADACEQARSELAQLARPGQSITAIPADLSDESDCQRLADAVGGEHDRVHALFNNAGATWGAPLEEFPSHGWDKVLDLNLKAPFYMTTALLPLLEKAATEADPARVVNIGSVDGLRVPPVENYSYAASKAGLHHLTRVLARALGPRNITVNAIAPGPFETKMMAATLRTHGDVFNAAAALGRTGREEDLTGVAVFLAAPASAYITGAVLPVDGGISTTV